MNATSQIAAPIPRREVTIQNAGPRGFFCFFSVGISLAEVGEFGGNSPDDAMGDWVLGFSAEGSLGDGFFSWLDIRECCA
jgi:hypothetical protein